MEWGGGDEWWISVEWSAEEWMSGGVEWGGVDEW